MNQIQAVLFDYGMVLSGPPDPAAWAQMRVITGLDEESLDRAYWAYRHPYDRGDLNPASFWQSVASNTGIDLTSVQLTELIAADTDLWSQLNPPMVEWAQRLQRAGIRTGILSNMPDAVEAGLRARHDWIDAFDHHTWSHAVNLAKPEPAIYRHAAKSLQTPPANILFIDDKPENIDAAIAGGMQAIQYLDHATFEREMRSRNLAHLFNPVPSAK